MPYFLIPDRISVKTVITETFSPDYVATENIRQRTN
jgi:hypothetical protein